MDERTFRQQLHHAADARLSGFEPDPWLAERVLASAKGKQKKKVSMGVVLAAALILAAMTALAVGLTTYFKGFASMEDAYGEYESWPDHAKANWRTYQVIINARTGETIVVYDITPIRTELGGICKPSCCKAAFADRTDVRMNFG